MYSKAIDDTFGTTNSSTQSSTKGKTQAKGSENTKSADKEGDIDSGNYHIKLVSVTKSSNDYEGKPTAILTYELTNKKNENSNFMDVDIQAFQNGHELDTAIYMDQPEGYDAESSTQTIQPGASKTVTVGYVLEDEISPVSIEASGTLDMSDAKVTGEFPLQWSRSPRAVKRGHRGCSSVGRAFRPQRKGHGFDSRQLHFFFGVFLCFFACSHCVFDFSLLLVILNMST